MASSLPSTIKAWQYSTTKGGLEKNLNLNNTAPLPKPKPDQHLIKIIATALNPADYKAAEFPGITRFAITTPATPSIDFAGTIVTPASNSPLEPGQLVFGCAGVTPVAGGALSEYAIANANITAAIPEGVDPVHAATVGVAARTAYQSIIPYVKQGEKVFINGGSGGTGVWGIQFAKAAGCEVTATCSTKNVELVKGLGADRVVDYTTQDVVQVLKGVGERFDHAVDNVGTNNELIRSCHEFLKQGKKYVAVGSEASVGAAIALLKRQLVPSFLGGVRGNVVAFWPERKLDVLVKIGEWMSEGKVRAVIDERFAFEDAVKAIVKLKTGRARGKIVIDVAPRESST